VKVTFGESEFQLKESSTVIVIMSIILKGKSV